MPPVSKRLRAYLPHQVVQSLGSTAGDCVGRFMQISVAVGEGALAARSAIGYVKKQCG